MRQGQNAAQFGQSLLVVISALRSVEATDGLGCLCALDLSDLPPTLEALERLQERLPIQLVRTPLEPFHGSPRDILQGRVKPCRIGQRRVAQNPVYCGKHGLGRRRFDRSGLAPSVRPRPLNEYEPALAVAFDPHSGRSVDGLELSGFAVDLSRRSTISGRLFGRRLPPIRGRVHARDLRHALAWVVRVVPQVSVRGAFHRVGRRRCLHRIRDPHVTVGDCLSLVELAHQFRRAHLRHQRVPFLRGLGRHARRNALLDGRHMLLALRF